MCRKRLRSGSDRLQTCCCGHRLCRQTLFLGVQVCRLAGLKGSAAAAPDSVQTCGCGHHLCRQTLFLGVDVCRLGRLKSCAAAPDSLQTCCCGHHLCWQTVFLGVQVCRLAGLKSSAAAQTACKRAAVATNCAGRLFSWRFKCVAAPHSLQTCCCGQQLCRQTVFLGVQVCRLAGLKGSAAAQTGSPPVPADSFLGGSSVPFGRPKRLRSGSRQLANVLLWPPPVPADSFLGGSNA